MNLSVSVWSGTITQQLLCQLCQGVKLHPATQGQGHTAAAGGGGGGGGKERCLYWLHCLTMINTRER